MVWAACLVAALIAVPREQMFTRAGLDYFAFPLAAFVAQWVPFILLKNDLLARPARQVWGDLVKQVPFWAGLALFTYFTLQALNPWGTVVERDLFWKIFLEKPVTWLPSGLAAPLLSDEDPGGMNAWRVMLILGGPWLLLCALRVTVTRRRTYVFLGWVALASASCIAVFCLLNQPASGEVLGFKIPVDIRVFGVFMNRNHGGVYLYLNAAIALSLTFWHLRRAGGSSVKGGPYLLAGFIFLLLSVFALFSNSVGALLVVGLLLFLTIPVAVIRGMLFANESTRRHVFMTLAALLVAAVLIGFMADFQGVEKKVATKVTNFKALGLDDRAPLRAATWEMATAGGTSGKVWTGWGAGSYRWVSPVFQARQPALQDAHGHLQVRAVYAHCDWLQMLAEWGVIGILPVLVGLGWLATLLVRAFRPGTPETIPLACVLVFFGLHAAFDLLCWFTPLLFTLAVIIAALGCFIEKSSAAQRSRTV